MPSDPDPAPDEEIGDGDALPNVESHPLPAGYVDGDDSTHEGPNP